MKFNQNMLRLILICITTVILILNSCSSKEDQHSNPPVQFSDGKLKEDESTVSSKEGISNNWVEKQADKVYGKVKVVDASGNPIENVGAIATLNSNAFDEPLAWGSLTGKDGISEIWIPKNLHVYIRAWDPKLRYFPNNFFEIPPTDADSLQDMTITMLEACAIEMTLYDTNENPISNENIGLMMIHSKYGAWWPSDGYTDENGKIVFTPVPPGVYNLRIKTEKGILLEIRDVSLPPGSHTILGKVMPN